MFFPPPITVHLPQLPLENMEELAVDRLTWFAGYDIEKRAWVTLQGLNCDQSAYDEDAWKRLIKDQQTKDLIQSIKDIIGTSLDSSQQEKALKGMNILLRGAIGTGRKTVARAICNILKRPMLDIRASDIPRTCDTATLAVEWKAVVVVHRGDYFMSVGSPIGRERIDFMVKEFEKPGCVCLWPVVLSDEQQALLTSFSATIRLPDLDLAARRRRWLQLFGRDDLAEAISSGKDASVPIGRDTETVTFLREIEKISWYELDGTDIDTIMDFARSLAEEQKPTPQEIKEYIKAWGVPISMRSKVARFFALREMQAPDSAVEEPSSREYGEDVPV
ncbi:uncharacterized protein HD556DRAFT_1311685 [Suillus plorans]|uniref:Uncharacterized protein n=1 Tax=Suillus plorans TaxID=116603 RepID=A0A9P7AI33_9AGAM|nr:uncharacterized protein HD556DRAFT_1311685 [Suillus plorans]KAG1788936.1 hypothetical protein HD556DRAFT_1311685 [Suillus plorans]